MLNGIALALPIITCLTLQDGRAWHTPHEINRDPVQDSVLVHGQLELSHYGYPEKSNCSGLQFGLSFCGKPVGGGHGSWGWINVNKLCYLELHLTSYRAIEVRLVSFRHLLGVAVGLASHFVNLPAKELL